MQVLILFRFGCLFFRIFRLIFDLCAWALFFHLLISTLLFIAGWIGFIECNNEDDAYICRKISYRKEIKIEHEKVKAMEQQLEVAEAKVRDLEKERNNALKKAKTAERELGEIAEDGEDEVEGGRCQRLLGWL